MKADPETLYRRLGALLADVPVLDGFDEHWNLPTDTLRWLASAEAIIDAYGDISVLVPFRSARDRLIKTLNTRASAQQIEMLMRDVFARLELQLPAGITGEFISAGSHFDAFAALTKLMRTARTDLLVVDPYLDASCLVDFGGAVEEGVRLRLLADEARVKRDLSPAVQRWSEQNGDQRPVELRVTPPKALHDRLIIIDGVNAWVLTQSIKDFAKRSPATIQQVASDIAQLKIPAFEAYWVEASLRPGGE